MHPDRSVVGELMEDLGHGLNQGGATARVNKVDVAHDALYPVTVGELGEARGDTLAFVERELTEVLPGLFDRSQLVPELGEYLGQVQGVGAPARVLQFAEDFRHLAVAR